MLDRTGQEQESDREPDTWYEHHSFSGDRYWYNSNVLSVSKNPPT